MFCHNWHIIGSVMGPKALVLEPFGKLFINLMFMILVPLVFFSITSAMANISGMKRLSKIIGSIMHQLILDAISPQLLDNLVVKFYMGILKYLYYIQLYL